MRDYDSLEGFVSIDFRTRFPHKFWISSWSKDEQYPHGFRYKLLSVRPQSDDLIELVVLLEQSSGAKTEMTRLKVSLSALDKTVATFTDGLGEEYNIQFTELDLTNVRNPSDFESAAKSAGWDVTNVQ